MDWLSSLGACLHGETLARWTMMVVMMVKVLIELKATKLCTLSFRREELDQFQAELLDRLPLAKTIIFLRNEPS